MKTIVSLLTVAAFASCGVLLSNSSLNEINQPDPFAYLEEVRGEQALAWVDAQNAQTLAELEALPGYRELKDSLHELYLPDDQLLSGAISGGYLYMHHKDADNPKGVLKRATLDSISQRSPSWQTLFDVGALGQQENVKWDLKGYRCSPEINKCLISLSPDGGDATETREFDLASMSFDSAGARVPVSKSRLRYVDETTYMIGSALPGDPVTDSGYPMTVKLWTRGSDLESATTIFTGESTDVGVWAYKMGDTLVIEQGLDFFNDKKYFYGNGRLQRLSLPSTSVISGRIGDTVFIQLKEELESDGQTFSPGSVVMAQMSDLLEGGFQPQLLAASSRESVINSVLVTENTVVLSKLEDVISQVEIWSRTGSQWSSRSLELPGLGAAWVSGDWNSDDFYVHYSDYLTAPAVFLGNTVDGTFQKVDQTESSVDTSGMTVSQHFVDRNGVQVPYFMVHQRGMELDGNNPTLQYGYGGFEISVLPSFREATLMHWVAQGGVYVVANIRGGGEYGPEWHQAALKHNRHVAFEDFEAVAEDLFQRGVTRPEKLAIEGGSNGGLLVGAVATRRPDMFGAVLCHVPLLDMLRFHRLLAGASWMGEYGNPDNAEDRAYLEGYSPYHNLRSDASYPEMFFTTSTADDRVHPGHARKMAAKMESQGHAMRYFEDRTGGHGGASIEAKAAKRARELLFLFNRLGASTQGR